MSDNKERTLCMLDAQGYKHTLRICNTYCFSTAAIVVRTRRDVTLYVHCFSCLFSVLYTLTEVIAGSPQYKKYYL